MITKVEEFQKTDQLFAARLKALGHPARIAIVKHLANMQSCVCGEIVDVLHLAQSTVSQHLKALKDAGLVKGTISGPKTSYCLNKEAFQELFIDFSELQNQIDKINLDEDCC